MQVKLQTTFLNKLAKIYHFCHNQSDTQAGHEE